MYRNVTSALVQHVPKPQSRKASTRVPAAPSLNEPCYRWLLANLHNPYPTQQQRERLRLESKATAKAITTWFVNARKRIGWSHLRATRFNRSQIEIVAAASRFWPERDTLRPLSPDLELHFAEIEHNAVSLYANYSQPSDALQRVIERVKGQGSLHTQTTTASGLPNDVGDVGQTGKGEHLAAPLKSKSLSPASSLQAPRDDQPLLPSVTLSSIPPPTKPASSSRPDGVPLPAFKRSSLMLLPTAPSPQFGKPSLVAPDLKRPRPDAVDEPVSKRRCVLPTWDCPSSSSARRWPRSRSSPTLVQRRVGRSGHGLSKRLLSGNAAGLRNESRPSVPIGDEHSNFPPQRVPCSTPAQPESSSASGTGCESSNSTSLASTSLLQPLSNIHSEPHGHSAPRDAADDLGRLDTPPSRTISTWDCANTLANAGDASSASTEPLQPWYDELPSDTLDLFSCVPFDPVVPTSPWSDASGIGIYVMFDTAAYGMPMSHVEYYPCLATPPLHLSSLTGSPLNIQVS
ncbi:uncharacterized protein SCHCODRAFT_02610293 [Schizophyllum commune H4-8]|uniref:uncharacterized protein n=1 Tax=Schizophyllum commune (strain H4-8 / FGSC 9210) TaxID=578458 RepID=UPI00215DE2CB|nr:uncharacterized protein SCHCODRAFT_02610293 [Schizophyllum commune H4-8]KAI5897803.1 hypothetical protein SCHCODRAFT_02610293 [Schizophyllum commune H4-8]